MNNCISSILQAPVNYINELRYMKSGSVIMKGTSFYPSFIFSVVFGLLSMYGLAAYMIYYFIVNDGSACYVHVKVGIIILACLYPIESTIYFICLLGSAGTSSTKCWKFFIVFFFGLLLCGLGFGGLGFVYLCILNQQYDILVNLGFLTNQTFIEIVVYCYMSFIILYLVMMPILSYSYNQRNASNTVNAEGTSTCCDTLCCFVYYFFQFLFFISILFMVLLKIVGPVLLVYDLVEVGRAHLASASTQTAFYALTIIGIFGPLTVFIILYIVTCCCCKGEVEEVQTDQTEYSETTKNETFLTNQQGKEFGDDRYEIGNNKL